MDCAERRGQQGQCRQTDRDRTDAQLARKSLLQFTQLLSEAAVVCEHAVRPRQHAVTFRCEPHESLTPLDDENPQSFFELLYPR